MDWKRLLISTERTLYVLAAIVLICAINYLLAKLRWWLPFVAMTASLTYIIYRFNED